MLSASWNDNKIAWYRNVPRAFSAQRIITTDAEGAHDVHAADLDGDGDPDVLSASHDDDTIAWYENCLAQPSDSCQGETFSAQRLIATDADGALAARAADLDGDGWLDVVYASTNDDTVAWHRNSGGGSFSEQGQVISTNADLAIDVNAADLDGDGDLDVFSASRGDAKVAWYQNEGEGRFSAEEAISRNAAAAECVHAADLDGDGDLDLLSASWGDDKIAWYENCSTEPSDSCGSGAFSAQRVITTNADAAESVYATDLDLDGDLDVLSASYFDDKIAWYENCALDPSALCEQRVFSAQQVISLRADQADDVHAADLDGDGDPDVLSASSADDKVAWYENCALAPSIFCDGGAFSAQRIISWDADWAESVYAVDLDGDGDLDVLSASWNDGKIAWYENLLSP